MTFTVELLKITKKDGRKERRKDGWIDGLTHPPEKRVHEL